MGLLVAGCHVACEGLHGASVVAVFAVPWLLLSFVFGCSLMLLDVLQSGQFGAVCFFVSAAPVLPAVAGCFGPC